jgi:hypothetical protein
MFMLFAVPNVKMMVTVLWPALQRCTLPSTLQSVLLKDWWPAIL